MESKDKTIADMNKFLKGVHMGGTTFKDYLEKAEDKELKEALKNILESFKRHEEAVTHRIEQLGGDAADTVGVMGMMGEFFEKVKMIPVNSDKEVLEHAIKAVDMGIKNGNKFLYEHKDMEGNIKTDLEGVVKDYDNHLRKLESIKI